MIRATAASATSVIVGAAPYRSSPLRDASLIERYIRWFAAPTLQPTNWRPVASIRGLCPTGPQWLSTVQQRIASSVVPIGITEGQNNGRWITQDIADAGAEFFQATSDLLPGEPFIYSSQGGDLVAEFESSAGTLTAIVSRQFVILFASIAGCLFEKKIEPGPDGLGVLRRELEGLAEKLVPGRHGVDTTNRSTRCA
jgi:hypothetical protein